MAILWVLVANSGCARIFEIKGHGKSIKKMQHFDFPGGRKKEGEINTDRQGHGNAKVGFHGHSMAQEVDCRSREQEQFAHLLIDILEEGRKDKSFEELAIVAPAQFLGKLKQVVPDKLNKCISKEISKDLPCTISEQELTDHLCRYLDLWNR